MAVTTDIDVNDLYSTIMAMAQECVAENEAALTKEVYAAADEARDLLKADIGKWSQTEDLPERQRLAYERGWKSYHHRMQDGHVDAVVANAAAPGLTHLIEKGHELFVNGVDMGIRTTPRPHIADAYEKAASDHFKGGA